MLSKACVAVEIYIRLIFLCSYAYLPHHKHRYIFKCKSSSFTCLPMFSSFTHCLNAPKMSSRDSLTLGKWWGGKAPKHHGKVWNCHRAAFKNPSRQRVLRSHDLWFPKISKRCQTFRNGKPKFSAFSTSETSWIADDLAQEQDAGDLDVSHVPWRQGHLLRFEDKHG